MAQKCNGGLGEIFEVEHRQYCRLYWLGNHWTTQTFQSNQAQRDKPHLGSGSPDLFLHSGASLDRIGLKYPLEQSAVFSAMDGETMGGCSVV